VTRGEADRDRDEDEALVGLEHELALLRARRMADPPLELLRAAREGVLPEPLQQRVAAHVSQSEWSRTLADDLELVAPGPTAEDAARMLARVRAGTRGATAAERPALTWRALMMFGSLAAAAILFAVRVDWRAPTPVEVDRATAAPGETAPATPPFVLALAKPDLRVSLTALQWRGSPAGNPLLADLKPAFAAIERDDFAGAARVLEPLASRYPASIEVFFYLGVSRLLLNDSGGARDALAAAGRLKDDAFAADVAWYLAIAEERLGDRAAAGARLDALCRDGGARSAEACGAASKLR
jgi:hypothetical protein